MANTNTNEHSSEQAANPNLGTMAPQIGETTTTPTLDPSRGESVTSIVTPLDHALSYQPTPGSEAMAPGDRGMALGGQSRLDAATQVTPSLARIK